jgi:hypothetical protein
METPSEVAQICAEMPRREWIGAYSMLARFVPWRGEKKSPELA